MNEVAEPNALEVLLVREGAVTEAQLARARRIAGHLPNARRPGEILVEMGQLARAEYEHIVRLHRSELTLAAVLQEDGALDAEDFATYERGRRESPGASERELLVDSGLVREEPFLRAVGMRYDIPCLEPEVGLVDTTLLTRASFPWLTRHCVLPLRIGDGALTAILADPLDPEILGELERIYRVPIKPCCATAGKIHEALCSLERFRDGKGNPVSSGLQYREIEQTDDGEVTGEGAIAILDYVLLRAIQLRASDLHIEPQEKNVRVPVRVDGALQPLTDLPASFAPQVISRVKVLAGANIAESRLHQDGRIAVRVEGREIDIRVSTYASVYGETLVLRLLDRRRGLVPLEDLNFEPRVLATLRDVVLRTSSGLVLVTGPTGSGKTTTLYSFVDFVNAPDVKTISCEDPVEYVLDGVTQWSVNQKTGPTFADSLKAIVRQDPDVIVVGEVRDKVTAGLAVEAALTGHKVFSTFHTEDSVGALVRLSEMGVEPFLLASTLLCVIAQRLVRRVCPECREPAEATREDMRFLGLERSHLAGLSLVRGAGCATCGGTGFSGRVGIHEMLLPDDDFRDAVMRRASSKELRALARSIPAYLTLQETGLLKAGAGVTTLSEVVANAPRDGAARRPAELRELMRGGVGMSQGLETGAPSLAQQIQQTVRAGRLTLPPLPEVAMRIGEMLRDEDANPRQVGELITNEPAIAASVLRMANSASFGGLRAVGEVDEAVARLGMRQVGAIVTAVAHKGHFESSDPQRMEILRALWDHAIATAAAARHLAGNAGADGEESFLAGLLHDIGKLLVLKGIDGMEKRGTPACAPAVVNELMDMLHVELGHVVLVSWKIPEPVCPVARHHHDGSPDPKDHLLARVQAANAIARKLGAHPSPQPDLDLGEVPAIERLGLSELEMAALMVDVEDELARVKTLL